MLFLIVYDISVDSIRNKVSKILIKESFERLQLSVFIGNENPAKNHKLWQQFQNLIKDDDEAKFYVFPIPDNSLKKMQYIGQSDVDIEYLLGNKDSFFI